MNPTLANMLWYLRALPDSAALRRACTDVADTQERLLQRILQRSAASQWGQHYQFARLRSVRDYQQALPLTRYADYAPAVAAIGAGQRGVLTRERVLLLEPTSGSTAATKYIPYTASLKAEFQRAIHPWIVNLFSHLPDLLHGPAYWSISPVGGQPQRTPGGVRVGFTEDSEYFGRLHGWLLRGLFAVPPQVRLMSDIASFRYVTLLFLLRCADLRLISVWNPSFLVLLLAQLPEWWPRLVRDIADGTLRPPLPLAPALAAQLAPYNRPAPRRAAAIRAICRSDDAPGAQHALLWPALRLISCWADDQAARGIPTVARLFPHVPIQGKGLIATEGIVSLPLLGLRGSVLALRSHFFEFVPLAGGAGRPKLAHELEQGASYAVVLTTGGGLYRYQLQDAVQVVEYDAACPVVRFVGKLAHVSDHFGEKLNAAHVRAVLDSVLPAHGIAPEFVLLACEDVAGSAAYVLFIETADTDDATLAVLATEIEARLCSNYHYAYCRRLGQLAPLRVFRIHGRGHAAYLARCQALGQRLGDIKLTVLHRVSGWAAAFDGRLL